MQNFLIKKLLSQTAFLTLFVTYKLYTTHNKTKNGVVMSAHYIIAYDVKSNKRRRRCAKVAYSYALGGQKSALESALESSEHLCSLMNFSTL